MARRTLRKGDPPGDDIRFLHVRLNQMLPKTMDQLPESGDGANDFGPRTEAKVKAFQEKFKIDEGKKDYKDGVVGAHTYDYLERCVDLTMGCLRMPPLELPIRPPLPPPPPKRPSIPMPIPGGMYPPASPVPELLAEKKWSLAIQPGTMIQRGYKSPDIASLYFQVTGTALLCDDLPLDSEMSLQTGTTAMFTLSEKFPVGRPNQRSGTDIQFFVQLTVTKKDLFGAKGLSAQLLAQAAMQNLVPLNNPKPVLGLGLGLQVTYDVLTLPSVGTFSLGLGGMPLFNYSFSDNSLQSRWTTGSQWTGFINLEFGNEDTDKLPGRSFKGRR
jgi:hypothetical protein